MNFESINRCNVAIRPWIAGLCRVCRWRSNNATRHSTLIISHWQLLRVMLSGCTTSVTSIWYCCGALRSLQLPLFTQEYSKTVLSSSTRLHEAARCRQVLYYVVDTALRLISPFMPFLSEELWQRLPHGKDREESICVASYPTCETVGIVLCMSKPRRNFNYSTHGATQHWTNASL